MAQEATIEKLRMLPVQLVETGDGVIVKRGCIEINILGEGAVDVVQAVIAATAADGATRDEICELFSAPDRPSVASLIEKLESRRILVSMAGLDRHDEGIEPSYDVFLWHFGEQAEQVSRRLAERRITIAGVNYVSRQLAVSLATSGAEQVEVVDYPTLRNLRLFDASRERMTNQWPSFLKPPRPYEDWKDRFDAETPHCVVATSDFGGLQLMREWNHFCVSNKLHFLPVVLQDLIGYVGPLVVPGETACFECLRARQNAVMDQPEARRASEYFAFEQQAVVGFHPSMASILGDIAAIELTKLYGIRMPLWRVGTLIEVNLVAMQLKSRKVLKIPRCAVCSPLKTRSSVGLTTSSFALQQMER